MRQYTHRYETDTALIKWLESTATLSTDSVLIQIFSGVIDVEALHNLTDVILNILPKSVIIGTTTSGEIIDGEMFDESIVISFSQFNSTKIKSVHIADGESQGMGVDIAKKIIGKDTKCIIMFADGLKINGDALLRGISSAGFSDVVVAGGLSADNGAFHKTYCIHGREIFERGVVAVSLSNPDLEVFHTYNLSWKPIGKKMVVTKSEKNIVYELDNKPIKDVYAKYLGDNIVKEMPASTIEFPLITHENGLDVARSMISVPEHNGIMYAGELAEGSEVRFGIGSPNMLAESAYRSYNLAREHPIEGVFVYSCTARKALLGKGLETEFAPLAKIAPMSGFFTYGEFFHGDNSNKLLNVTTTVLGISETKKIKKHTGLEEKDFNYSSLTINALFNLVEVTMQENEAYAQELVEKNKFLKLKDSALNAAANGIVITDIDGRIEWANKAYSKLTGYDAGESIGYNPRDLVNSNMHDKGFFQSLWNTILSNKVWHGELVNRRKDGTLYDEEMTITPMTDENGDIQHFVAVKQDITERKKMQRLINKYAFYDTLTNLPNRRLLADRLSQAQALSKRSGRYAAVIFLDLDNFKPLNDTYGHKVGDSLLVEVAHRLHACIRDSDTVARFGGDEFVVLLSELSCNREKSAAVLTTVAEKIRTTIAQPFFLTVMSEVNKEKVVEHHCTASIGVALFLNYEADEDEIIKWADSAMYDAKEAGRNQIKFHQK